MTAKPPLRERLATVTRVALDRVGLQPIVREPADLEPQFYELYRRCAPYTMTSVERMYALWQVVRHVSRRRVQGAFVECGVWRGGSSMLAALTFAQEDDVGRQFYLYDTFEGMSEPTQADGVVARYEWERHRRGDHNSWCYSPVDEVTANMLSTGLSPDHLRLVKGRVEDTLSETVPERIALLRLDTDWYESTRHELERLYPLLQPGGVLIVDDYGDWEGARRAVDEYMASHRPSLFMMRVDPTGRVGLKLA
jgi:O-methyltransferase